MKKNASQRWFETSFLVKQATDALPLIFTVVLGVVLRLHQLEARAFYDEAASWTFAHLGWHNFWDVMWNYEGNMVFYYVLLRGWTIFGDSEFAVRSLSVITGTASILAIYLLGSYLFNRQTGRVSAALLAVHAFHVHFSQEARGYALQTLLLILSTYLFAKVTLPRPDCAKASTSSQKLWAAYIVVSALAVYSQLFAVLVLAAQWLSPGFSTLKKVGLATVAKSICALALLTAPIAFFVLFQDKGQLSWVPPLSTDRFIRFIEVFTGSSSLLSAIYITLCLYAIVSFVRANAHTKQPTGALAVTAQKTHQRLLILWLIFPIAITIVASTAIGPLFVDRLFVMCLPALVLLAGFSIVEMGQISTLFQAISVTLLAAMIALSIQGNATVWRTIPPSRSDFQNMAEYVLSHQEANDAAFVFPAATSLSLNYYLHQSRQTMPETESSLEIVFPNFGDTPSGAQPIPIRGNVEAAIANTQRIWLILDNRSIEPLPERVQALKMTRLTLAENFTQCQERKSFGRNLTVELCTR